jgi:hypothetical protein
LRINLVERLNGGILYPLCEVSNTKGAFIERKGQQKKYLVDNYEKLGRSTAAYRRHHIR